MARVRTPAEIGALAHAARTAKGWNQQRTAAAAGVSRRFISSLESGSHANAELWRVLAVLDALGIELHGAVPPVTAPVVRNLSDTEHVPDTVEVVVTGAEPPATPTAADDFDLDQHLAQFRSRPGPA